MLLALTASISLAETPPIFTPEPVAGGFTLVGKGKPADIIHDAADHEVVAIAARNLAADIAAVTGYRPRVSESPRQGRAIIAGTLGHSRVIDGLVAAGKLEVAHVKGAWESFIIAAVNKPMAGVEQALVVVGSDRRGTAYGLYELSEKMGVSPWHWWADVPVRKRDALHVAPGLRRFGPPSVKYRGIFINDEDWGLHPWASRHFDPETGDIGPKTYERVFDLLLRLKANTLWPAMHKVSAPFNHFPQNKVLADRYAIVMGSSHAEPMLRNNVGEWSYAKEKYNYETNADLVLNYWEARVRENASYENVYTLGMRGIHDSGITAGAGIEEKIALLERIIADQRGLLKRHVDRELATVPQVFTPYKEVLELYRKGLRVPADVGIIWPDDNHGFIRQFPNEKERRRRGGSGIYYHLSYLGSPLAYLWLYSTPPALVWEEMHKAYALGARDHWIINVGDIKPAEIGIELFLQMAWDIERWDLTNQADFLRNWAQREFGPQEADNIAALMQAYFELNYRRKPEHLQWWLPHSRSHPSDLTGREISDRLQRFATLAQAAEALGERLGARYSDAFFELVEYPVRASSAANHRYFHAEQYAQWFHEDLAQAKAHGRRALRADAELSALTQHFNEGVAGGKWKGIMNVEPADDLWRSYRQTPPVLPTPALVQEKKSTEAISLQYNGRAATAPAMTVEAEDFSRSIAHDKVSWQRIKGLGRSGDSVGLYPVSEKSFNPRPASAPYLEYDLTFPTAGDYALMLKLLPTYPLPGRDELRLALGLNTEPPKRLSVPRQTGDDAWKQAVLSGVVTAASVITVPRTGMHRLRLYGVDSGIVVDQILINRVDSTSH